MDKAYQIATWLIPLVIAIVFHEVAHGLVANRLGDPTARQLGRLSLNPLKHVDPMGTVILPLILALTKAPVFGWAKPVPVVKARLNHPRRDMMLVALAGPGTNFLLAIVAALLVSLFAPLAAGAGWADFITRNAINFLMINLFLAVFNLIPLPPFDGGHVVEGLLPSPLSEAYAAMGRYAMFVLIGLLLLLPMLGPQYDIVGRFISPIVMRLAMMFLGIAAG